MNTQIYIIVKLLKDFFIVCIDMDTEFLTMILQNQSLWKDQYIAQEKKKLREHQAYQRSMTSKWKAQQRILRLKYEGKL